jgi:type 1 glutamine amidotransferase
MFFTGLGHSNETWQDPTFQSHIYGAMEWLLDIDASGPK